MKHYFISTLEYPVGGVLGASWAPWGMRYGNKFDEHTTKEKEKQKEAEKEIDEELEKSKK